MLHHLQHGDIHRRTADEIAGRYTKDLEDSYEWRHLGKTVNHACNYDMGATTLSETILEDLDLVKTIAECKRFIAAYHSAYPDVRRWHERVKQEVMRSRKLTNPFGRERTFYGRRDAAKTHREAFAQTPQSTASDTNKQALIAIEEAKLDYAFLENEGHDSQLYEVIESRAIEFAHQLKELCQIEFYLEGEMRVIPVGVSIGKNWRDMEEVA